MIKDLDALQTLTIPRYYRDTFNESDWLVQLHVFVDSSEKAFAACAYFRFESQMTGKVRIVFVMGKCRVAPIKPLTIPKLELQAAVLGTRLASCILKEHRYRPSEVHFWTDSTTVLNWIYNTTSRHPIFIASRVAEIQDSTMPKQWHHVPGKLNVADEGSRGLSAESLGTSRWLNGPAYLLLSPDKWPEQPVVEKSSVCSDVTDNRPSVNDSKLIDIDRFSSWNRLWRTTAYVLRFVNNCRQKVADRKLGVFTVEEKRNAENELFKLSQKEQFDKEIVALREGRQISKQSTLAKLSPFLDSDGILRSRGRIGKSDVSDVIKYPIILSNKSRVTHLVIRAYHNGNYHEGMNHLRNSLRERFWILKARSTIRKVTRKCMFCRKRNAVPNPPIMGDLPDVRVRGKTPCFYATGVDYFGPIQVRRLRKTEKRYGCLFVCMATKAIHLEVAHSLDSSSFIQALRRFIGRRGKPHVMYSDNGTNFVGAERELREGIQNWNQEAIANELTQENIEWHFNPPGAPHFGGLWEANVKSVKRAMYAILAKEQVVLTDEVLQTVFVEVEALLNGRPLTPISDDINDLNALTPNHFLLGRPSTNLPPDIFYDTETTTRRRWRQSQALTDMFWKRWLREYLPYLLERTKWYRKAPNSVNIGDLVLVADRNQPRGNWLLSRVVETFPGSDNVVRVVRVKTKFGLLKRPVTSLILLSED